VDGISRFNLDGYLVYGGQYKVRNIYSVFYRNGGIEIYTSRLYTPVNEKNPQGLNGVTILKY